MHSGVGLYFSFLVSFNERLFLQLMRWPPLNRLLWNDIRAQEEQLNWLCCQLVDPVGPSALSASSHFVGRALFGSCPRRRRRGTVAAAAAASTLELLPSFIYPRPNLDIRAEMRNAKSSQSRSREQNGAARARHPIIPIYSENRSPRCVPKTRALRMMETSFRQRDGRPLSLLSGHDDC